jgi:apolipoprotein D and lipocalin family protein
MDNKIKPYIWATIIIGLIIVNGCERRAPPKVAEVVNLKRYMGTWYEIASIPNRFQRECSCTHLHYKMKRNYISVVNRCWRKNKWDEVKGKAFDVKGSNGTKLKLQLFWPFKGNHWILWIDKDYKNVLVGSPNYKNLWILSRDKKMTELNLQKIKKIAKEKGYDVEDIIKTQCNHHKKK